MKNNKKTLLPVLVVTGVLILAVTIFLFVRSNQVMAQKSDFSKLSWAEAFVQLHDRMTKEYAFTEWKGIEWQRLYDDYLGKIETAQAKNDFPEYYITLRSYLHEIPDGHVGMNNLKEIDDQYIGGGFGIAVTKVEDGRIIISWVDEASSAWAAGIRPGAEMVEWDGRSASDAVAAVSPILGSNSATEENLVSKKLQYLVRAPIGKSISIKFLSQDKEKAQSAEIISYEDQGRSLKKTYPDSVVSDRLRDEILGIENLEPMPEAMVETKTLAGNLTYIKVWGEFDADLQQSGKTPSTLELFRTAVQEAIDQESPGLILDLRNNLGGLDDMAADILGSFYGEKTFYEYQNVYNQNTGERQIVQAEPKKDNSLALFINPAEQCFKGRVIALINPKCVSSGEGIAMGVEKLPNGETLGFMGTNGSFGLSGSEALMPGEITVRWPAGQSLNENKEIQLDSRGGVGGVAPSIKIPMTMENALRIAKGEDVELEEAARILSLDPQSDQALKYTLYIGLNDKDTYKQLIPYEEAEQKVRDIAFKYVDGFTVLSGKGAYKDDDGVVTYENSLVLEFTGATEEQMDKIMDEVLEELNQNSVLMEKQMVQYELYEGQGTKR